MKYRNTRFVIHWYNLWKLLFAGQILFVARKGKGVLYLDCWIDWERQSQPTATKHELANAFRKFADDIERIKV